MLRINNLKIRKDLKKNELFEIILKKYTISKEDILTWNISKKSIDARKKEDVYYVYAIDLKVKDEKKYPKLEKIKESSFPSICVRRTSNLSPIIVGCGPSGLFAAVTLVQHGIKPIIIEQGEPVEERQKTVNHFLKTGILNPNSNIQFGEGGAGTFSDGKLNTGIHSPYNKKVLQEFVQFGAPESILYLSKPHIGTDILVSVLQNLRQYLLFQGANILFSTKMIDFELKNNKIQKLICQETNGNKFELETDSVILAIGHSSRDTFRKIAEKGIQIEAKNFSVGVRIEHLQQKINHAQYGTITKLKLPAADYKLAYHNIQTNRSCYTFCMCPGGTVMASSSEPNTIVTNGMSTYARNGVNSNSALLVNVTPDDFSSQSPLAGLFFQEELEKKAFALGGNCYFAPIQKVGDFLANVKTTQIGAIHPSYQPGVTFSNLNEILPKFISDTLKEGILYFDTKLKGFAHPDAILTGLETRSSSPIRILRNESFLSNKDGIYPCGEGAGYAGGIMSAAVDGIKCAISLLEKEP